MNFEKGFPLFFVLLIISKQVEIWLNISINRRVNDHYGYNIKISVTPRLFWQEEQDWAWQGRRGGVGVSLSEVEQIDLWVNQEGRQVEHLRQHSLIKTTQRQTFKAVDEVLCSPSWLCCANVVPVCNKRTRWTSENMRRRIVKIKTSKRYNICFSEERIGNCWDGLSGVLFSA